MQPITVQCSPIGHMLKEAGVEKYAMEPSIVLDIDSNSSLAETLCEAAIGGHLVMGAGGSVATASRG